MNSEGISPLENLLLSVVRSELAALGTTVSRPALEAASAEFLRVLRDEAADADVTRSDATRPALSEGSARLQVALTAAVHAGQRTAGLDPDYLCPTLVVQPALEEGGTVRAAIDATLQLGDDGPAEQTLILTDRLSPDESSETLEGPTRVVELAANGGQEAWNELEAFAKPPADPLIGKVFDGKYRIDKVLGVGGFGKVYRAVDTMVGATVAIKTIRTAGANDAQLTDFKEEARRVTRLDHPNIIQWKALNVAEDGTLYFVMEYLRGEELEDLLEREERLAPERAQELLLQILGALRAAHHLKDGGSVLHLDLKPKNVFMTEDTHGVEMAKVIDFGIGQLAGGASGTSRTAGSSSAQDSVTVEDSIEGTMGSLRGDDDLPAADGVQRVQACTPPYCSPEQARHLLPDFEPPRLDGRADLYSFGILAFRMLTGTMPFEQPAWPSHGSMLDRKRTWMRDFLMLHIESPPKKIAATGVKVPRKLANFVERCLRKEPDERFRDTHEAYEELEKIVHPGVTKLVAGVAASVALVAALAVWWLGPQAALRGLDANYASRPITDQTLYAGPAGAPLVVDVGEPVDGADFALLDKRDEAGSALEAWSVRPLEDSRVEITPAPGTSTHSLLAFLRLTRDGESSFTNAFTLRYLSAGDWKIDEFDVPDRGERAVDPEGLRLQVRLGADQDDLASVVVRHLSGERLGDAARAEVQAVLNLALSEAGRPLYEVDLAHLALGAGSQRLAVEALDRAGGTHSAPLELFVVREALQLVRPRFEEAARGEDGTWYAGTESIELAAGATREAQLRWRIVDATGRPLQDWSEPVIGDQLADRIDLHRIKDGKGFSGILEIEADEQASVLRASAAAGAVRATLPFRYIAEEIDFRLTVAGHAAADHTPTYVREPAVSIEVDAGHHELPMRIRFTCEPLEAGAALEGSLEAIELQPTNRREAIALELLQDGLYRITATGLAIDRDGAELDQWQPFTVRALVVLDRVPPEAVFTHPTGRLVVDDLGSAESFVATVRDASYGGEARKLALDYRLSIEGPAQAWVPSTPVAFEAALGAVPFKPFPWDAAQRPGQDGDTWDGIYHVELGATDAAGNRTPPIECSWEVAVDPPELTFLEPGPDTWEPTRGKFVVRVRARDPNGVQSIVAHLAADGLEPRTLVLTEQDTELSTWSTTWRAETDLPTPWSLRPVQVRVEAVDRAGRAGEQSQATTVSEITRKTPAHATVAYRGRGRASMCLVEGNTDTAYTFGGRSKGEEQGAFFEHELGKFENVVLQLDIPRGGIQSYYIDEHEVSVGQFLAFVLDSEGYVSAEHWPAGAQPEELRRAALVQELRALDEQLPITNVRWEEAAAYATWAGKTLPTWLQWEYAVRGGAQYLPFANALAPAAERDNVNVRGVASGPWPVDAGGDRAQCGAMNLCTNVSEWTRTPFRSRSHRPTPEELLTTDPPGPEHTGFFFVGGSFRNGVSHFLVKEDRGRSTTLPHVGFRCVASAETLERDYESGGVDGYEVRAR